MAYENNSKQQDFKPTYYSPLRMSNPESGIDPSQLSFTYWNNLLGIIISPKMANTSTDYSQYDSDNNIKIYINHTKARILYTEMQKLKADPDSYQSVGVHTNSGGLVAVCNGKEVGANGPVLILRKMDSNSGQIISSYMYEFKRQYYYSIQNFEEDTLKYDKNFYDWIEFDEFSDILRTYFENAGQMLAMGVVNTSRFEFNRVHKKMNMMMQKLGIEYSDSRRNNAGGRSFFDMANEGSQFSETAAAGVPDRNVTNSSLDALVGELN